MILQPQIKKKPVAVSSDNVIESIRSVGASVGKAVVSEVAAKVATDAITTIFASLPKTGELKANEPITLTKESSPEQAAHPAFRPEFVRQTPIRVEEAHLKAQIESVRQELKLLAASLKQLNTDVAKAIMDIPVNPGVYHVNFFDRLRGVLRTIRQNIEDSGTWMALMTARKQKRGFWGMYKKHGTTFGLSSERSVATQAG